MAFCSFGILQGKKPQFHFRFVIPTGAWWDSRCYKTFSASLRGLGWTLKLTLRQSECDRDCFIRNKMLGRQWREKKKRLSRNESWSGAAPQNAAADQIAVPVGTQSLQHLFVPQLQPPPHPQKKPKTHPTMNATTYIQTHTHTKKLSKYKIVVNSAN